MGYVVHHPSRSVFETSLLLVCVVRTQNIYFLRLMNQDLNGEKVFPLVLQNFENTFAKNAHCSKVSIRQKSKLLSSLF